MYRALAQAACTSGEIGDGASFVLNAESDEDAADDQETTRIEGDGPVHWYLPR